MAFRLALEAPPRFRAVAAVSASVPTPENFKCKPAGQGTSSVMIMNGTRDPINPFEGGEVKFLGLLKRGKVRSSRESGQYLADLNNIISTPETSEVSGRMVGHSEVIQFDGLSATRPCGRGAEESSRGRDGGLVNLTPNSPTAGWPSSVWRR